MRRSRKPRSAPNLPEFINAKGLKSLILAIFQLASNSCEGWNYLKGGHGGKLSSSSSHRHQQLEPTNGFVRYEPRQPYDSLPTGDGEDDMKRMPERFTKAQEQFVLDFQTGPEYSNIRPEKSQKHQFGGFKRGRTSTTTTTSTPKPLRFWHMGTSSYDEPSSNYDHKIRRRPMRKKTSYDEDNEDQENERNSGRDQGSSDDFVRFGEATVIETVESNEVPKPFYTNSWLAENEEGQKRGLANEFYEEKPTDAYSEESKQHKKYHFQHPSTRISALTTTTTTTERYYSDDQSSSGSGTEEGCLLKGFQKIGDKCYFHGNFPLNWYKALEFCNSLGLEISLAAIETKQEDESIKNWLAEQTASTKGVWIGGSDNGHRGTWVWLPTGQPVHYHNWGLSQPTGIDQHCMFIVGGTLGYQWADFHCDYEMHFLCEHHSYPFHHEFRHNKQDMSVKNNEVSSNSYAQKRTRFKNTPNWLV